MIKKIIGAMMPLALPLVAFGAATTGDLNTVLTTINKILTSLIPVMITLGLVLFFWGLFKLVLGESGEGKEDGKKKMLWGLVALFVMVSVWGIIKLVGSTFGVGQGESIKAPSVDKI